MIHDNRRYFGEEIYLWVVNTTAYNRLQLLITLPSVFQCEVKMTIIVLSHHFRDRRVHVPHRELTSRGINE